MRQLKDLAIMTMYIYIFAAAISGRNIAAVIILSILIINLICSYKKLHLLETAAKERLNQQRETFINYLNHDLRIPIIAQLRALELLNNKHFGELNNAQTDIIEQTEQSCRCMLNLTSLIINTYKMENNSYKLIYERFNISDVIISCFDELLPAAAEKNITFEYDGTNKNININADKEELKKVILNLLSSLITNASLGEKVSVILSSAQDRIRLTISSNTNKFFTNIEKNSVFTSVGHSIRMGFCKKIIEYHHGKIVENNNNNSFSFEIPQFGAA